MVSCQKGYADFSFLIITMSRIYVCMHVRVTTNNNNYGNIVSNFITHVHGVCVCGMHG